MIKGGQDLKVVAFLPQQLSRILIRYSHPPGLILVTYELLCLGEPNKA